MSLFSLLFPQTDRRILALEYQMSQLSDALLELDAATNAVAERLEDLANDLDQLDLNAANEVRTHAARLRELAADPDNPVPPAPLPEPQV